MKKEITVGIASDVGFIIRELSQLPKNPLKFCLARNASKLNLIIEKFEKDKAILFNKHVKIDVNGNGSLAEMFVEEAGKLVELGQGIPYSFYEYNSQDEAAIFFKELSKISSEKIEVEFVTESLSREIKVSDDSGNYMSCTIESILEDPNNNIDVNKISILMEYFLVE